MNLATLDLAQFTSIGKWQPKVGDFVVQHGWLTHWYGVISGINARNYTVEIIRAGLPFLLMNMSMSEMEKAKVSVDVGKIKRSKGGKYAIQQQHGTGHIWFV